jgi:hypothetical protein
MSWVTIIWGMISSACLTLALVHTLVWWRRFEARANLLFALTTMAIAVFAGFELWMMRAGTPAAQKLTQELLYVPLPAEIVAKEQAAFSKIQ